MEADSQHFATTCLYVDRALCQFFAGGKYGTGHCPGTACHGLILDSTFIGPDQDIVSVGYLDEVGISTCGLKAGSKPYEPSPL